MNIDPNELSSILRDLYAAGLDSAGRARLAPRVAAAFGAQSCMIQTRDRSLGDVAFVSATANVVAAWPVYIEHYFALDKWFIAASRRLGEAVLGEDLVPEKELVASQWYNDFLRRCEIHQVVGAEFEVEPGLVGAIAVHRPSDAAAFTPTDRAKLAVLLPHLVQALKLLRRLDASERGHRAGFDALAGLSIALFVVTADGRVRMMNEAAERLAASASGVRLRNGQLALGDPGLDDSLQAAVRRASLAPLGRSMFAGETIFMTTSDGRAIPLKVSPMPPDALAEGIVEPLAAVFVGEPRARALPPIEAIRSVYGLTPAESRLLFALLRGQRIRDYAADIGISIHTAQAQLKSVFAKTGCNRQADLVRKVMGDPILLLA